MITAPAADPFAALFAPPVVGAGMAAAAPATGEATTFGTMLAAAPGATVPTPSFRGTLMTATLPIGTLMTAEPAPAAPLLPPGFVTGIAPPIVKSAAAVAMTPPVAMPAPSPEVPMVVSPTPAAVPEAKGARPPVAVPLPGIDRPATSVEIAPIVHIVQPAASDEGITPIAAGSEPDATVPVAEPRRAVDPPRSALRALPADTASASPAVPRPAVSHPSSAPVLPTPVEEEDVATDAAPVSPVPVQPTVSSALTPIVAKVETPVAKAPAAQKTQAPIASTTQLPAMTDMPAPPPVSVESRPIAARDEPTAQDTPATEEDATVAPPLPTMMAPPLQPLVRDVPVAAAMVVQSGAIDPPIVPAGSDEGGSGDRSEAAPVGSASRSPAPASKPAPATAPAAPRAPDPVMTDRLTPAGHTIASAPATGARAVREDGVAEARAPGGAVTSLDARSFAALVEQKTAPAAPVPASPAAPVPEARVAAEPGKMGHEMGVAIARHAAEGGGEALTVRLNPAEFGRVDVTLSFDDRGTLRAAIAAESPAALDLLRRDSADLGRALTDAGMRTDAQSFRFDARQGGADAGGQGAQGWQRWQQPGGTRTATTTADEPQEPVYRPLRTQGRVDLMA